MATFVNMGHAKLVPPGECEMPSRDGGTRDWVYKNWREPTKHILKRDSQTNLAGREEPPNHLTSNVTRRIVRVDEECQRDDGVDANAHGTLEVIALAVLN